MLIRLSQAGVLLALLAIALLRADAALAGTGPLVEIAAGGSHTCALTSSGEVRCWGDNDQGQIGAHGVTTSSVPLLVEDVGPVTQVSAGTDHTCAVTDSGGVMCWGRNGFGQLGNGANAGSSTPVDVCEPDSGNGVQPAGAGACAPLSGVVAISAGGSHTCVVVSSGAVLCWGINQDGELGDGSLDARNVPVVVIGLTDAIGVASGDFHTCALLDGGAMQCWGFNTSGQLGDGTTILRATPVDVLGLPEPVASMSAGGVHTCARTTSGRALCWGGNRNGQAGNGSFMDRLLPTEVANLDAGVRAIIAGWMHTCTVLGDETVACWGDNGSGQLGDDTRTDSGVPTEVTQLPKASLVTAGGFRNRSPGHSCAFAFGGGLHCWGANGDGQLGIGTLARSSVPVAVRTLSPDVDCNGEVTAIDVALLLQSHVGLLSSLACDGADVDGDEIVSSIDAVLVLQFIAGL